MVIEASSVVGCVLISSPVPRGGYAPVTQEHLGRETAAFPSRSRVSLPSQQERPLRPEASSCQRRCGRGDGRLSRIPLVRRPLQAEREQQGSRAPRSGTRKKNPPMSVDHHGDTSLGFGTVQLTISYSAPSNTGVVQHSAALGL